MKVYERSLYTVTSTGMISPSSLAVFALKFLQKSMMFTPWGPSAVPTGGAGVALPAAIWSFTSACIFLAMLVATGDGRWAVGNGPCPRPPPMAQGLLNLLYLQEVEFHGCRTTEDRHHHLERVLVEIHFVDHAIEAG